MKGRITKLRLQSKAVEALSGRKASLRVEVARRSKEKGQHKQLRTERIKEIKIKPFFSVSISASLKEVQRRFIPND
jgi:signal-transduction protein with cAMP-binding, CBS, and nucleotidyltransferase domain